MERLNRLQSYKCHKVVRAARIVGMVEPPVSQLELEVGDGESNIWHDVPPDFFRKNRILAGGYFVVYDDGSEDGFQTFIPAETFEVGYALVEPSKGKTK